MHELYDALHIVEMVTFGVLGAVAAWQWLRHRSASTTPIATAFVILGILVVGSAFVPSDSQSTLVLWLIKAELVCSAAFPFFLYRFVRSLRPIPRAVDVIGTGLAAATVVYSLAIPRIPGPRELPGWVAVYLALITIEWLFLSAQVVYRLYRHGHGQPTTARARMRTLATGAAGLSVGLILAVLAPTPDMGWIGVASVAVATASGPLFLLGFAPPRLVRVLWRQREVSAVRDTEVGLMEALEPAEVAKVLLPEVARLVGTDQAALVSLDGEVIGAYGMSEPEAVLLGARASAGQIGSGTEADGELAVRMSAAWLVMRTSPYAPFFGRDEREVLDRMAILGDLALERVYLVRQELEQATRLTEAQALAKIGSWEYDPRSGRSAWSEQLYRNWGLDPSSFDPTLDRLLELIHVDDRARLRALVQEAIATRSGFEAELRGTRSDGSAVWIHARGRVVLGPDGEVFKLIGTSQDITSRVEQERIRAEQARSIEEQARLLDLVHDAIFMRDMPGRFRYWNQGAERLYGWTRDEVLGRQVTELLHSRYPQPIEEIKHELVRRGHWEGEVMHRTRSGETVVVDSRWTLRRDENGEPTGILELNTDITERKRQEEMRDRFIADAAHELRTPLTTLLGFTDVLSSGTQLNPDQTEMAFEAMGRAGRRMASLVNNLLDLSKLSAGRVAFEDSEVEVARIVKEALSDTPPPEGKDVRVRVTGGVCAVGQDEPLTQVVSNLLTNAYRYGGPHITVEVSEDTDVVTITVRDDGGGVPEELVPSMFEPFARSVESSQMGGSGLGLAIVKSLTEACGGWVAYEPAPGGGACFKVGLRAVD